MNFEIAFKILKTVLGAEVVKEAIDDLLDKAEARIAASPSKWDDELLQPAIGLLRRELAIPDDIGGDED